MEPAVDTLLQQWSTEQPTNTDASDIFKKKKKKLPDNMMCRARTWTGRCQHQKCQTGTFPHLCTTCVKKAIETPVANSFQSDQLSINGTPPKRIGLRFGTIDTPITELIFAPDGTIATVWPNSKVRTIVSQELRKGNRYHPGSKEAKASKVTSKPQVKRSNKIMLKIKPHTNNITQLPQKIKIKIKIKKLSQQSSINKPSNHQPSKESNIKFIKPATFRADGTVDFGFDDESEDEQTPEVEDGEDPIEFLQNEIQQAGGITKVKLPQLKSWLSIIGLSTSGNKKTLQNRITTWMEGDESDSEDED